MTAIASKEAQNPILIGSRVAQTAEWKDVAKNAQSASNLSLADLLSDDKRCEAFIKEHDGVYLDFNRQLLTEETFKDLLKLAEASKLKQKIEGMFKGEKINTTENRSSLHVATRAPKGEKIVVEGVDQVGENWETFDKIKAFTDKVRNGQFVGATGKPLKSVVAIGIGGSYLGPLFVHTAFKFDQKCSEKAQGRELRFLANVDPIDVSRNLEGLVPETTLAVVISKTFTTAETMLNARTVKKWLVSKLGEEAVQKHMIAVSTNISAVKNFGIDPENTFGFKDWVGGRYSVCSSVGVVPLSLQYGFENVNDFLKGAHDIDVHFKTAPFEKNIPVILGLLGVWNNTFLGHHTRAILPYCQALATFPSHFQQLSMESNGKGVDIDGNRLPYQSGEVEFGEPGTNGQHSFYQLIHQGRVVPCEFIGIIKSQQPIFLQGADVSNHDELMSNFFAQADALAYGKSPQDLKVQGTPEPLIPHKTFSGNRPSLSILLPQLNAYTVGQLLSIYEHRIAVQGWIWGINSFDQWGVELGKVLATKVRSTIKEARDKTSSVDKKDDYNCSTVKMLNRYLHGDQTYQTPKAKDIFPAVLQ